MTREQHLFKVMSAVRDCLQSCAQSATPTQTLRRYVERLERDPLWEDADVVEVERTAGRALAGRQGVPARGKLQQGDGSWPPQPRESPQPRQSHQQKQAPKRRAAPGAS